jgi:hypothetical protein
MSATAEEVHALGRSLYHWSVYEPAIKAELGSTAFAAPNGLVVFDPAPLAEEAWAGLLAIAPLRAIVLTSANHVRDTARLREKHHVPVATSFPTRKDLGTEFKPDIVLLDHEVLYGFAPIAIPGATPGETAFFGHGAMILGDAVLHIAPGGELELLPEKYCADAKQNRASLRRLLDFDFHTLTFAHGSPLSTAPREKLAALLNS